MADHAPVMMWMTDPTGSLSYLNGLWSEFTGQTHEEALGYRRLEGVASAKIVEGSQRIFFGANAAREPFRIEYRLRRGDGSYRWALSAAAPRFGDDGEFLGYIGSVIDIEDRKEAEQILQQANEMLEAAGRGRGRRANPGGGAAAPSTEDGSCRQAHRRRCA